MRFGLQDVVRAGAGTLPRQRAAQLVRGALRRAAGAAARRARYVGDISLVFIYGLCGLSLMVLAGYTGLVSLGHAAFLGVGAYAHVFFVTMWGCRGSSPSRSRAC